MINNLLVAAPSDSTPIDWSSCSGELRRDLDPAADKTFYFLCRDPGRTALGSRSMMNCGLRNIVAVPLTAFHRMRGSKPVALIIVEQPYQ